MQRKRYASPLFQINISQNTLIQNLLSFKINSSKRVVYSINVLRDTRAHVILWSMANSRALSAAANAGREKIKHTRRQNKTKYQKDFILSYSFGEWETRKEAIFSWIRMIKCIECIVLVKAILSLYRILSICVFSFCHINIYYAYIYL